MALDQPPDQSKGGPPGIPRGSRILSIGKDLIARALDGLRPEAYRRVEALPPPPPTARPVAEPSSAQPDSATQAGYMNPGRPQAPVTEAWADVAGRAFDYPSGYNTAARVRQWEGVTIESLRNIAENYDLLRLAIETRKDQLSKLQWSVLPKRKPGTTFRPPADERCAMVEKCLRRPDGVLGWEQWIRALAEDSFVLDGVAIYRRRYPDGRPYALELVDPQTIQPFIDITGRRPLSPQPAYGQIIKGSIVARYTTEEMTYWVRNPRSNRVYGFSPCEQIIRTAMIGLGRMGKQLGWYTDGNLPDTLLSAPPNWTGDQIAQFQQIFDAYMAGPGAQRKARFVPAGAGQPVFINSEAQLFGPFDEWLARIVCYAFSLPPFPFIKETNRSTAESSYDSALNEGLGSYIHGLKAMLDREIEEFFGMADLELVWDDQRKLDPAEQAQKDEADFRSGRKSLDDLRAAAGQEPAGLSVPLIFGLGPAGFMTPQQVQQMVERGENMPPPPMSPEAMGGAVPGGDPLAGADPEMLRQLGIGSPAPGEGQGAGEGGAAGGIGSAGAPSTLRSEVKRTMAEVEGNLARRAAGRQQPQQPQQRQEKPDE